MSDTYTTEIGFYSVEETINKYDTVSAIEEYLSTVNLYFEAEDVVDEIIDIVEKMPPVDKWIPVNAGLPEVGVSVLYCTRLEEIDVGFIDGDGEWSGAGLFSDVVAWRPLPDSYEED